MQCKRFILLFVLCCTVLCGVSYGQSGLPYYKIPENKIWIFGAGAGMDFNAVPPVALQSNNNEAILGPKVGSGTAAVSNNTGQLRFYAQLDTIWNSLGNVMPNGGGLIAAPPVIADTAAAYFDGASLIVPFPGSPGKYFVFSQTSIATSSAISNLAAVYGGQDPMAGRLYYSLVDMSLNGGLGDVVTGQKGIQIDSMLCDRLVSIEGSDCNIWILCMKNDGSAIHAFEVSGAGINPNPVISPCAVNTTTGVSLTPLFQMPGGCIRASAGFDSAHVVVSLSGITIDPATVSFFGGGFQMYDFNRITGIAYNQVNVLPPSTLLGFDQQGSGLCFSPNGESVFRPHGLLLGTGLFQYNVAGGVAAGIIASQNELNTTGEIGGMTGIRLGADDKVYLAGTSLLGILPGNSLHRIENPNAAAVTLTLNAVTLTPGATAAWGLGNATLESPPADTLYQSQTLALCAPETSMQLVAPTGTGFVLWDDGSNGPTRTITGAGTYWVLHGNGCPMTVDTFIVEAVDLRFDLGNDTTICGTLFPFELKAADVPGASYQWQDGSTAPTYEVTTSGEYSVSVSKLGCTHADTIRIEQFDVFQDLGRDTMICAKTPFSITLRARVPQGATVLWSTGATTPEIHVSTPGTYAVQVNQDVCVGIDTIRIRNSELCDCIAFMPSAFTPNGDGLNDVFMPRLENDCLVRGYNFNIFNRWGEKVFSSVIPGTGWDGSYNGKLADAGTYMFTISFEKGTQANSYTFKGDVTLVR